jgi:hypothetical protein
MITILFSCISVWVTYFVYNYLYKETAEDTFHKTIHSDINKINDSPIAKFSFHDKESYEKIKNNIYNNDIFEKHITYVNQFNGNFTKDLTKNKILNNTSHLLQFKWNDEKHYVCWIFNHYYLGPDSFYRLKADMMEQEYLKLPNSDYKGLLFFPKFVYDSYKFLNSPNFTPLPRIEETLRYKEDVIFQKEEYENHNKRNVVLYHIISKIYKCLQLERPMRILLPIGFKRFNKINNNLGAILFTFQGNETLDEFSTQFNQKKYMALVSNSLLICNLTSLFCNNNNLRKKIDVVLTAVHSVSKDNDLSYHCNWSTGVSPTEPLYVSSYSTIFDSHVHTNITYTITCKDFKKTDEMIPYEVM